MKTSSALYYCIGSFLLHQLILVHCLEGPFLDQSEANNFLRRRRRSNTFFEEFLPGNLERECIEESCSREEAREISDDDREGVKLWNKYSRCKRDVGPQKDRTVQERTTYLRRCIKGKDQCKPFPCVRSNTVSCQGTINSFECVCKPGFTGRKCESPINECSSNPCQGSARCEDEIGGFRCICDSLHEGILCENEINDCRNVPSKRCGSHGECLQPQDDGPYQCLCHAGYKGERCLQDIDECEESSPCQHDCTNIEGSFQCSCRDGFLLDLRTKTTCKDVNECDSSHNCQGKCHNTEGGYYCSCGFGYKLDDVFSRYCEDVNECAIDNGGCPMIEGGCGLDRKPCQTCHNNDGGHVCYCPSGFTTYVKGRKCEDIDECLGFDNGCEQSCENFPGGYRCLCQDGYKLSFNKKTCVDINECLQEEICDHGCTNNRGSYECTCKRGFKLAEDGRSCIDEDECATNETKCSQLCVNTLGSYACGCRSGFKPLGRYRCNDINECSSSPCGRNGRCHDGVNSYTCECRHGYSGSNCELGTNPCLKSPCQNGGTCVKNETGFSCSCTDQFTGENCDEQLIVCEDGYELNDDQCVDVDECREEGLCDQNCENTKGSYSCTCTEGYEFIGNRCHDIDECDDGPCEQTCWNVPGSFRCSCGDGYVLRPDERGCDNIYSCFNSPILTLSSSNLLFGTQMNDYVSLSIHSMESIFYLRFKYRTLDPDALLVAMSDRSSERYIFVTLVEGRLHVSAKLVDGHKETSETPSTKSILDTAWHQVSIRKRKNRIRIYKDRKKLKDLKFSSDDFGSVNMLYYGGLPPDFPFTSDSLQYRGKWLQGCLSTPSYDGMELTTSSTSTPNRSGCFENIQPGLYFNGTGYISRGVPGGSTMRLRFSFKSRVARGTIARVRNGNGDQFSLEVEGNQLIAAVITNEGQRFSSVYTAPNAEALCRGVWHVCDVTVSPDRIRLHVDGVEAQQSDLNGMTAVELSGNTTLYLGGGPGDESFFAGSLQNFKLNNRPLDFGSATYLDGVFPYSMPLP